MKCNEYLVLAECVERGIARGWSHAHKHADQPSADDIRDKIHNAVLVEISDYFFCEETVE